MKKLLAAGERRIFTLARVYRDRERGPLHHPEFTMLEWYRAGEPYAALMDDCEALLAAAAEAAGTRELAWRGLSADPFAAPERLTVAEAFDRFARSTCWPRSTRRAAPTATPSPPRTRAAGLRVAADDTWSDLFSRILAARVEPGLGRGRATILDEYPAAEAALARVKPGDPRVAERFELYACGVELANAFGELADPAEQRRRLTAEMDERERVHGDRYPLDEEFLDALAAMPEASGIALGLDRLAMLATGAGRIEQVLWAPVPGAERAACRARRADPRLVGRARLLPPRLVLPLARGLLPVLPLADLVALALLDLGRGGLDRDRGGAVLLGDPDLPRRRGREVDDPALRVRAAVVHLDLDLLAVLGVGHGDLGPEGKLRVGGGELVPAQPLALAVGLPSSPGPVERGSAPFLVDDTCCCPRAVPGRRTGTGQPAASSRQEQQQAARARAAEPGGGGRPDTPPRGAAAAPSRHRRRHPSLLRSRDARSARRRDRPPGGPGSTARRGAVPRCSPPAARPGDCRDSSPARGTFTSRRRFATVTGDHHDLQQGAPGTTWASSAKTSPAWSRTCEPSRAA
jgi:lysyl-tRNA synthetase class 2